MTRTIRLSNPLIMGVEQIKETLHLRIEQADEKLLTVLAELTESLFKTYQPEALEEEVLGELPAPPWAKSMTKEESLADIREGLAEYNRGEYISLDEIDKEAERW